jgi:uncharacterized protein YdeI (YjbR/CyaY-like superfamily)
VGALGAGLSGFVAVIGVTVERDEAEREVEIPVELAKLLEANPAARNAFEALSHSHRREHALHVAEAIETGDQGTEGSQDPRGPHR